MKRGLRRKLYWRIAAGLLVAVGLVIVGLPTAVGSRWIYQPLVNRLAADDFQLHVGSVQLRWLSPLRLRDVEVRQQNGAAMVRIDEVRTDRGLLAYLVGGRRLGRIKIIEPVVNVELLNEGSNLERFVKAVDKATKQVESPERTRPQFDIEADIRSLSAVVKREAETLAVIAPFDVIVTYQAASGDSHLSIAPTTILDHAVLTPELVELGLDYAVPVLASSAWFDGEVSLVVGKIDIPLERPKETRGEMDLTLHQVRSGPTAPAIIRALDIIAAVRGIAPQHELVFVDGSQVHVSLADARVHHSRLLMGLPKMDTRLQMSTSGSVGLEDRGLDLLIEVPVPLEQLARRDQVQALGVPVLGVPIGGTLDEPSVRWEALRGDAGKLLALMRQQVADDSPTTAAMLGTLGGLAEGKADETILGALELVQQLRERRRAANERSQADSPDARTSDTEVDNPTEPGREPSSEPPTKRQRPIRESIRNLFRPAEDK